MGHIRRSGAKENHFFAETGLDGTHRGKTFLKELSDLLTLNSYRLNSPERTGSKRDLFLSPGNLFATKREEIRIKTNPPKSLKSGVARFPICFRRVPPHKATVFFSKLEIRTSHFGLARIQFRLLALVFVARTENCQFVSRPSTALLWGSINANRIGCVRDFSVR